MKIICRSRGTGKTKDLIEYSLETGYPILAFHPEEREELQEKSLTYFGKSVNTVSIVDDHKGKVLIDNLETALNYLLKKALVNEGIEVGGFTLSLD